MINLPVFPVNSPQAFLDQMVASKPDPLTGKPDPAAMAKFAAEHPETVAATKIIKQHSPTAGFAGSTFSSLNTFYLVSASGVRTPVRWSLVPRQAALSASERGNNVLFDALVRQLKTTPLRWDLHLVVGTPEDPVDPTRPWPAERRVVNGGALVLDSIETERPGNARDLNFDPTVVPDGIEPSDDPILSTRSAVYAASYRARSGGARVSVGSAGGRGDIVTNRFPLRSRILHWLSAVFVFAGLLIGFFMVNSVGSYAALVAVHMTIGFTVLVVAIIRIVNRFTARPPGWPPTIGGVEGKIISYSERSMYLLLVAQPLVGWAMVSATGRSAMVFGYPLLRIAPFDDGLFFALRQAHSVLAYLLVIVIAAHVAGCCCTPSRCATASCPGWRSGCVADPDRARSVPLTGRRE